MRVLIVDDEYKVCQLIRHLIHWEEYGMEIVGMVNDGEEAFDVICREKPDIVITDIRMPGMDGIELVQKTQEVLEHVFFVIVSGYSQFEYARKAVKLGVEDYLVKPIRKKDLIAVIEKISSKYQKETADRSEKETLQTELVKTREKVRNNLLQDLLFTRESWFQTASFTEIREQYGCTFSGDTYRMLLVHLYENATENAQDEREFAFEKMQTILKDRTKNVCREFFCIAHEHEVICLLNMDKQDAEKLNRQLARAATDLTSMREIFPGARSVIVAGRTLPEPGACREYLEQLHRTLDMRYGRENQVIFYEEEMQGVEASSAEILSTELKKRLLLEIELMHARGIRDLMEEICHKIRRQKSSAVCISAVYHELVGIFLLGLQNYAGESAAPRWEDYETGEAVFYRWEDAYLWLQKKITAEVEKQEQQQKELASRPIRMAKKYINDHIRENVSLDLVSKEVGLNPAYFSTVFKKETGQNFMEYVTAVRMETARTLLTRSGRDVIDIACEVGYADVKYFSRLFKKHTSLTPTEYRKLYS